MCEEVVRMMQENLFSKKDVKNEGEDNAYDDRCNPGEIEYEIIFFDVNVAREFW
jgi:hypothetical protein